MHEKVVSPDGVKVHSQILTQSLLLGFVKITTIHIGGLFQEFELLNDNAKYYE